MVRPFAPKKSDEGTNRVFLAAFGKHPGWDDHIEDLGLETEFLISVKRFLYVEGIGGNVDSGAWDKLSEAQRLEGFERLFVWRTASDVVIGRMWSSMDGKGRTRYPMVVCAHYSGFPLPPILQQVLPRLEKIKDRCVNTTSASDIRSIIADSRRELRQLARHIEPASEDLEIPPTFLAELADRPEMGKDHEGLLRILYKIERGTSLDNSGSGDTTARGGPGHFHIRVPACADSLAEAILLWLTFLLGQFDNSTSVILFAPLGESWVDAILGQPTTRRLYCIRASLEAIPLTTDIPYTLDPDFVNRVERQIALSRAGGEKPTPPKPQPPPGRTDIPSEKPFPPPAPSAGRRTFLRWCAIAGPLVIVVGLAAVFGVPWGRDNSDLNAVRTEYNDWFGAFLRDIADKRRRNQWRNDQHLRRVVAIMQDAETHGVQFDPDKIDTETKPGSRERRHKASEALKYIKKIKKMLSTR